MTTYTFLAGSVLAAWLIFSILLQFPQLQRFRAADVFALIPDFGFFASETAPCNYRVVYRHSQEDGTLGNWIELSNSEDRGVLSFVWNPDRRQRKAMRDVCARLWGQAQLLGQSFYLRRTDTVLYTSLPYLSLLAYVSSLSGSQSGVDGVQFAILVDIPTGISGCLRPVFVSSLHRIEWPDKAAA